MRISDWSSDVCSSDLYIADFASHRARLVIEVDGGQHDQAGDAPRTAIIEADGYRIVRFWNSDVLTNIAGIATRLSTVLDETSPPPNPPPSRGRARQASTPSANSPFRSSRRHPHP